MTCCPHFKLLYIRYIKSCFYTEEREIEYIAMDDFIRMHN